MKTKFTQPAVKLSCTRSIFLIHTFIPIQLKSNKILSGRKHNNKISYE